MRLLYFFILFFCSCESYNILIATPNAVKSESKIVFELAYGLANSGNSVVYITGYKVPQSHKNLKVIYFPEIEEAVDTQTGTIFDLSGSSFYDLIQGYFSSINKMIWADKRMMEIWNKRKEYQLFITLSLFSEGMFPFLIDNDIPVVQVVTPGVEGLALARAGNWITPAIMSSLSSAYDENMNFWERSANLWHTFDFYRMQHNAIAAYIAPVIEVFPDYGNYASYYDRVALTLINGNFALDGPVPLLPSQIEIGTINAKKPKPLEKNLKDFVDSSGDAGVIYFSLGSIAKSADIPQHAKEVFVEAFKRMPQKVLWKYEGTDLKLPPNVLTQSWMPQQDILGHPKTKVFISHCGNLGTQEAKYHGVPVLALPIAFDQPRNAARMERKQFAVVLQWEDLTVDKVINALNTLINDQGYQDRLSAISRILQDQKESPLEKAIWWLEYVARHKGAPHLQYAGKRLSLFQYIMLDVILFWSALFLVVIFVVVYFIKLVCCRRGKGGKNVKGKVDKKKKQ